MVLLGLVAILDYGVAREDGGPVQILSFKRA